MIELPPGDGLDVATLSRLFSQRTNSYKYLFFLALLAEITQEDSPVEIPTRRVAAGMFAWAWFPRFVCKLSFGRQDKISEHLDRARELMANPPPFYDRRGLQKLKQDLLNSPAIQAESESILRYVKQRLLRPWFDQELAGVRDSQVDKRLVLLAQERFDERRPLFRLESEALIPHPHWVQYLRRNTSIVEGWACWRFARYLQDCNPNVPGIVRKLIPPLQRASLVQQQEYWKAILKAAGHSCIYTGEKLNPGSFALDHFLPWSFVAHDQLWNLVPVAAAANSSKSNKLPDDRYVERFVEMQARGLCQAREIFSEARFHRMTEPFLVDLGLPPGFRDLPTEQAVHTIRGAYQTVLPPLVALARQNGFAEGWHWA